MGTILEKSDVLRLTLMMLGRWLNDSDSEDSDEDDDEEEISSLTSFTPNWFLHIVSSLSSLPFSACRSQLEQWVIDNTLLHQAIYLERSWLPWTRPETQPPSCLIRAVIVLSPWRRRYPAETNWKNLRGTSRSAVCIYSIRFLSFSTYRIRTCRYHTPFLQNTMDNQALPRATAYETTYDRNLDRLITQAEQADLVILESGSKNLDVILKRTQSMTKTYRSGYSIRPWQEINSVGVWWKFSQYSWEGAVIKSSA